MAIEGTVGTPSRSSRSQGRAPFYVAGPYDDARSIIRTLTESVGADGFTYLVPSDAVH